MEIRKREWKYIVKKENIPFIPQRKIAQKIKKKVRTLPEIYINKNQLRILISLNSDYTRTGKSKTEIRYSTGLSYVTINKHIKKLEKKGLITTEKIKIKGNCKGYLRQCKLTDKGYEIMQGWREAYQKLDEII